MRPETAAAVYDINVAVGRITDALVEKAFEEFANDWVLQSAVERQFGIIGEALLRIKKFELPIFERFVEGEKIIGLRNIIVRGYEGCKMKTCIGARARAVVWQRKF